ncbi:MAG: PEP-CTERM sorting domain-containing protein [Pseudomonadota bacterium]
MKKIFAVLVFALGSTSVFATPIGDTVRWQTGHTASSALDTDSTAIVGAGIEFPLFGGALTLDVDALGFTMSVNGAFGGGWVPGGDGGSALFRLSDIDWVDTPGRIIDIVYRHSFGSLFQGISFTDNSISWRIAEGPLDNNRLRVNWEVAHVPEPSTLALLGLGLLAFALRKRA